MVALVRLFRRVSWDIVGISASTLCAIHCLVLPLLVMMGSISGYGIVHNHTIENVIIGFSAVIGFSSLVPAYLGHHRRPAPLFVLVIGFLLITLSRLSISNLLETVLTTTGAATVAIAHLLNWRICRSVHSEG